VFAIDSNHYAQVLQTEYKKDDRNWRQANRKPSDFRRKSTVSNASNASQFGKQKISLTRPSDVAVLAAELINSDEHWRKTLEARASELVHSLYRGLLDREPEPEALQGYAEKLATGHDLTPLLAEIAHSDEQWCNTLEARASELVHSLYRGLLDREPEPEALQAYAEKLAEVHDLTPLLAEIARSDEHWRKTLEARASELVHSLYRGLLDREPEPEALQGYAEKLATGHDLTPLLAEIARSDEHWRKTLEARAPELMRSLYRGLLGRDPDPEGMQGYLQVIREAGGLEKALSSIVASQEFKEKQVTKLIAGGQKANSDFTEHDLTEQKLVFLHIPKSGGTTLHNLLLPHFPQEAVCPERFNELRHFAAGQLARYRYFSGHFDLPSVKLIPGRKKIITMLREPVARLISMYYFQRAHRIEVIECNNLELARLANKYAMADFFRAEEVRSHFAINNAMTRVLTQCIEGNRWEAAASSNIDDEPDLEELKALDAFGIMERYDESVALIFPSIGLPVPEKIEKKQVLDIIVEQEPGLRKIDKEPVTEEIRSLIADLVKVDVKLYREACKIFEKRLAAMRGSAA
jgi:hypothetical protein